MNNIAIPPNDFQEIITITTEKLGLKSQSIVEKDFYVTEIIKLLADFQTITLN